MMNNARIIRIQKRRKTVRGYKKTQTNYASGGTNVIKRELMNMKFEEHFDLRERSVQPPPKEKLCNKI